MSINTIQQEKQTKTGERTQERTQTQELVFQFYL